ncbi:MAG: hypothetical protein PHP62_04625, partial [Candidatus Moranbacteria bacterium]|nr:hypothetical protein [Candidatus Moranbacteria bacterium]
MKKMLLPLVVVGLFLSSCATVTENKSDCESKCEAISGMCSEVITYEECSNGCNGCGVSVLDEIESEQDCDKIKERMSQCNLSKEASNNCEAACDNYNNQCLTLVPNADQKLFDQGYESCMAECKDWTVEKVECMEAAQDCP